LQHRACHLLTFGRIEKPRASFQAEGRELHLRMKMMASEPKRPVDQDNIVSLREARAKQAAQAKKLNGSKAGGTGFGGTGTGTTERKMPVLLIFLGMLGLLVAFKFLVG
jgi:hypothetical protein